MSRQPGLSEWIELVSTHMPHLSVPQARVLALWSYGIALTRSCGRLTVATFLALLIGQKVATVEQRLYEWCCDTSHTAGAKRQTLDATTLGARFVVLPLSVVYCGCGIPVAWTVLPANQPGAWRREWLRLLRGVRPAISPDWTVLVLADRGLWARWLFGRMVRLGWHPLLRINNGVKFRPAGQTQWYWLRELVRDVNQCWYGRGTAFVSPARRVDCTLVAWWGEGDTDPWFLLTDLAPEASDAAWYGLRSWCEQGLKCFKRGGWQLQYNHTHATERVARLWLALAVATLWMVSVGGALQVEPLPADSDVPDLRALLGTAVTPPGRQRRLRLMRLGLAVVLGVSDHHGRAATAAAPRPR